MLKPFLRVHSWNWARKTRKILSPPSAPGSLLNTGAPFRKTLLTIPPHPVQLTLKSYSHDANAAANLLAAHHYDTEAEQAYRVSSQLWPGNPEAAGGLATILARTGRADQARQLLVDFTRSYPDQRCSIETFRGSIVWTVSSLKPPP